MAHPALAAIILAAGKGTRMKSALHKVLHPIAGKPMLSYLLEEVDALGPEETILVVGAGREQLEQAYPDRHFVTQAEQMGTGHAAKIGVDALEGFEGHFIILFGDTPFIPVHVMQALTQAAAHKNTGVTVLGFTPENAGKYGRLILDKAGMLEKIVEYKDATEDERAVTLCNSGMMVINGSKASAWLSELKSDNAAGEYYLTDLVALARRDGMDVAVVTAAEEDVMGINSRADLANAEALKQEQWRKQALDNGVTMVDPSTVYFSADTQLGSDVTLEPGVFFGPGVTIEDGVTIKAYSHLEGATIRSGAVVGPFARLRPGADIGEKAKIGNFVEVKKADIQAGAKVSHLSYIGDATVGIDANIGAGTITCNYDGFLKYKTEIGAGAFIGSNSALVAPVTIGNGAIVGAGSVITKGVQPDALAVARGRQREVSGFAAKFREEKAAEKAKSRK